MKFIGQWGTPSRTLAALNCAVESNCSGMKIHPPIVIRSFSTNYHHYTTTTFCFAYRQYWHQQHTLLVSALRSWSASKAYIASFFFTSKELSLSVSIRSIFFASKPSRDSLTPSSWSTRLPSCYFLLYHLLPYCQFVAQCLLTAVLDLVPRHHAHQPLPRSLDAGQVVEQRAGMDRIARL